MPRKIQPGMKICYLGTLAGRGDVFEAAGKGGGPGLAQPHPGSPSPGGHRPCVLSPRATEFNLVL